MWSYKNAFSRNLGLITPEEQLKLKQSRVAILGMGGVGGIELVTLARLGIGKFTIADPDVFECGNSNRQYGAMTSNYGKSKVEVMEKIARDINPDLEIRVFRDPIQPDNIAAFLDGADIFVDAIDAFVIDIRQLAFREAYRKRIWSMSAAPLGFSTAWFVVDPDGMSFDQFFDISDSLSPEEKLAKLVVGLAPKAMHRSYMDYSYVKMNEHIGPSSSIGCSLAASVVGAETIKILLQRKKIYSLPFTHQFDAYKGRCKRVRVSLGNHHPLQRFKCNLVARGLTKMMASS